MTAGSQLGRVDVLVVGGGVAGLWSLHVLLAHGYDAWLVEKDALGTGQSVQAQGIVHGGGKYALRSVGDLDAIRAIREMPDRWRDHLSGTRQAPDLRAARTASPGCWLWLPRGSWRARVEALGLVPLLRHGGVLACPPLPVPREEWPAVLVTNALRAYRMEEPVLDTRSVLSALAEPVADRTLRGHVRAIEDDGDLRRVRIDDGAGASMEFGARCVVLSAGAGNADLLGLSGSDPELMQRRPLRMLLLRGDLPALHGHCIAGGRTRITVTSADLPVGRVWQVGGEVAERHASAPDGPDFHRAALAEVKTCLPRLDLARVQVSSYAALRAEARNADLRRPSGVQVRRVADRVVVAWPTKWAMAPLLAEEVHREVHECVGMPSAPDPMLGIGGWPRPDVAAFPWEDVAWSPVPSDTVA